MTTQEITIVPTTHNELAQLANMAAKSGFFGCKSPDEALMFLVTGRDLGLSYSQSLRAFDNIKGKLALKADAMVAICLGHPTVCAGFVCIESTTTSATWEATRVGQAPRRMTFTIEDARAAGIVSDMYKKWPQRMLSHRCKSLLARDVFPDLLLGLYSDEEVQSFDSPRQTAPTQAAPPRTQEPIDVPLETDETAAFVEAIEHATSADALTVIATQVKARNYPQASPERARILAAFTARKARFAEEQKRVEDEEKAAELDRLADEEARKPVGLSVHDLIPTTGREPGED